MVSLVHLVHPVSLVQPNKPERRDRPDRLADFFRILLDKESCSENQIRFGQNRFRFRQNVLLGHPLCGRAVMRTCQTSLQSYRLEFCANPLSARQHVGLRLAHV
jgi:hypothetical protein